jgi:hypothetical protein
MIRPESPARESSVIKFMAVTMAIGMIAVYTLNLFIPNLLHFDIKPTYLVGVLLGRT